MLDLVHGFVLPRVDLAFPTLPTLFHPQIRSNWTSPLPSSPKSRSSSRARFSPRHRMSARHRTSDNRRPQPPDVRKNRTQLQAPPREVEPPPPDAGMDRSQRQWRLGCGGRGTDTRGRRLGRGRAFRARDAADVNVRLALSRFSSWVVGRGLRT